MIRDIETGNVLKTLDSRGNAITSLVISPARQDSGYLIATGSEKGMLQLWDMSTGQVIHAIATNQYRLQFLAFSPDGGMLATAGGNSDYVEIWDTRTGLLVTSMDTGDDYIVGLAFSRDGQMLVRQNKYYGGFIAWDINTGLNINLSGISWFESPDLEITSQGHLLGIGGDTFLQVKDLTTDQDIISSESFSQGGICYELPTFSLSSDDRYLAMGCGDAVISIWDLKFLQLVRVLAGHETIGYDGGVRGVNDVDFSPYDDLLASAGHDGMVQLWNVRTGERLRFLAEHTSHVYAVDFSPDGRYLVSAGNDGVIRLWGLQP